jgi:Lipocalin-like domain
VRRTIPIVVGLFLVLTLSQTARTVEPSNKLLDNGAGPKRFPGAWRVLAATDTRPDGSEVPDLYLGPHPVGFLIYETTGYMCFGAMNPDRAKWADESHGTPAELATAAEGYDGYCGTYEINETRKAVTHHVRVGLTLNDAGTDLVRNYEFLGNQLKLSGTNGLQPGFKFWTITFERAAAGKVKS